MTSLKNSYRQHLIFWFLFWILQSLLLSGGSGIGFYLVKNTAIVFLQATIVYVNWTVLVKLLDQRKYALYALAGVMLIYLIFAISYDLISLVLSIFYPTLIRVGNDVSWWPIGFWRILSGSALYSIPFLASTIFHLTRNHQNQAYSSTDLNDAQEKADNVIQDDDTLMLKEGKVIHRLNVQDIMYVQGMKEYVSWHTTDKKLITLHSLASLEIMLGQKGFLRTHKSFIVNTKCVKIIQYDSVEILGEKIPIGRSYRSKVQDCFQSEI